MIKIIEDARISWSRSHPFSKNPQNNIIIDFMGNGIDHSLIYYFKGKEPRVLNLGWIEIREDMENGEISVCVYTVHGSRLMNEHIDFGFNFDDFKESLKEKVSSFIIDELL